MPIYEYRCKSCHDQFEVLQKFSAEPLTVCRRCGGELERLISPPALRFKGTGWYVTDYARADNGGNGRRKHSSKPPEPEKKTESKPEKTAPAAPKTD